MVQGLRLKEQGISALNHWTCSHRVRLSSAPIPLPHPAREGGCEVRHIIRTTQKWADETGLPICACGNKFVSTTNLTPTKILTMTG